MNAECKLSFKLLRHATPFIAAAHAHQLRATLFVSVSHNVALCWQLSFTFRVKAVIVSDMDGDVTFERGRPSLDHPLTST